MLMGQRPSLSVRPVSVLDVGACGSSSTPGDDSAGILANHAVLSLLNQLVMFMRQLSSLSVLSVSAQCRSLWQVKHAWR